MQIYLDNASSVPCTKSVLERFSFLCTEYFANQESLSFQGRRSFSAVKEAQEKVFNLLTGESPSQGGVLSGNTGSCVLNAAAEGVGNLLNGGIVTTEAEHPALLSSLKRVSARRHIPLFLCPLCRDGSLDLNSLESLLKREKIALLAVHHIQSETGRIQDLVSVRTLLDSFAPSAFFLADTIQSAGKYPLPWKEAKLDLAFVSGQKLGSPGGAFLLYRKNLGKILSALRTTEHLPGRSIPANILLLGEILEKLLPDMDKNLGEAEECKKELLDAVKNLEIPFVPTVPQKSASSYILHFLTAPYQGAILTRMLAQEGISVAPGSACSSESGEPSRTLKCMGIAKDALYGALRISFWLHNTAEEVRHLANSLKACTAKY